ncbi:hypothetical protein ABEB36_010931 [Hypothenemus hampei]|uniref:Uncharacterized protein n=1 Tax=Hypothenemus hampei TaxID=57062 RepID=A0ABD1EHS6_HYPHA
MDRKATFIGYKFRKSARINRDKSENPLAKLSYRELQEIARNFNLPVLFNHKVLLAIVIAHKQGLHGMVELIKKSKKGKKIGPLINSNKAFCDRNNFTEASVNLGNFHQNASYGNSSLSSNTVMKPDDSGIGSFSSLEDFMESKESAPRTDRALDNIAITENAENLIGDNDPKESEDQGLFGIQEDLQPVEYEFDVLQYSNTKFDGKN